MHGKEGVEIRLFLLKKSEKINHNHFILSLIFTTFVYRIVTKDVIDECK